MQTVEWLLYVLLGLAGVAYAVKSHDFKFTLTDHLPGPFSHRKVVFLIGFALVLAGFALAYPMGQHHGFISVTGGWLMLAGSAPWFNKRIARKFFDPKEWRVIRTTIYSGVLLVILSTGFFYLPPTFSPGAFLLGIAITLLSGRLWWNQDAEAHYRVLSHGKRDYS